MTATEDWWWTWRELGCVDFWAMILDGVNGCIDCYDVDRDHDVVWVIIGWELRKMMLISV